MVYERETKNEKITVMFNASTSARKVEHNLSNDPKILFGSLTIDGNHLTLPPRSGVVLK
jgi:hypothetical protein